MKHDLREGVVDHNENSFEGNSVGLRAIAQTISLTAATAALVSFEAIAQSGWAPATRCWDGKPEAHIKVRYSSRRKIWLRA
jgi:hypothetical protein